MDGLHGVLKLKDSQAWRFGREVEEFVIAWRKQQGCWIIRTHAINTGGAPMLEGWDKKRILPDIISGYKGRALLLEIKGKSRITFNQKYQRFEHGIPWKNWADYIEVAHQLGVPCSLGIYDAGIPDTRLHLPGYPHCYYEATLDEAAKAVRHAIDPGTVKAYGEPMAFFDMRYFDLYDLVNRPGTLRTPPTPIQPQHANPWEQRKPPSARQLPLMD